MTTVYFIRHSEPFNREDINIINNNDYFEDAYDKTILSFNGEEKALNLSKLKELQNIDYLVSSSTARTLATARYIATANNLVINIDDNFKERKFGIQNGEKLPENFENLQIENPDFKMPNGESQNDVVKRMKESLNKILNDNKGKRIVIVTHATALVFLFISYGEYNNKRLYVNNELLLDEFFNWNAPELFKATFDDDNNLVDIKNIRPID